jgi:DNA repair exonuclease SbcCD ATPase subunit
LQKTIDHHTFAKWHNLYPDFMKEVDQLISNIEQKVRKLIDLRESCEIQNKELKQTLEELTKTIEKQENTIKKLEERNNILTITKSLESLQGNVEVKNKINELVREIDKCIGLLNS